MSDSLSYDASANANRDLPDWQRNFNDYIDQIEDLKGRIQTAETQIEHIEGRIQREINPMVEQVISHKKKFVEILDEAFRKNYFGGRERERIRDLIQARCFELVYKHGEVEMENMYRRYSDNPFERFEETMSSIFETLFEPFDGDEPDENERFRFEDENQHNESQQRFRPQRRFRKEADQLQRVLRMLYTRLVKQLHPDREQDEKQQAVKNVLMQSVTEAYENRDWFELLRLYREHLPEEADTLEGLSPEQMQRLNQELYEQIQDLERKWNRLQSGDTGYIYRRFSGEDKEEVDRKFALEKLRLQNELMKLRDELEDILEKRSAPKRFRLRDD